MAPSAPPPPAPADGTCLDGLEDGGTECIVLCSNGKPTDWSSSRPPSAVDEEPLHVDTGDQMKVKQVLDESVVKAVSPALPVSSYTPLDVCPLATDHHPQTPHPLL